MAFLVLADGSVFEGESFGANVDSDGEVVFTTNMAGYPESLTDPSFRGQILVFTYPLIGNYGVPSEEKNAWGFSANLESEEVHVRGVVTAQASTFASHHTSVSTLHRWLEHHKVPGISGVDTRALTRKLREHGVMLGRITQKRPAADAHKDIPDPNVVNLVTEVSCTEVMTYEPERPCGLTIVAYDCGMKRNILRSFLKRGVRVVRVPWDFDLSTYTEAYDGLFVSNGPGDPKACVPTITSMKYAIDKNIPTFGICLGNQLMGLAIGGDTYKLKYGHRGANQPCLELKCENPTSSADGGLRRTGGACIPSKHCIITSQNHGFALKEELPAGWSVWFRNANDGTVEGIKHESGRFFAVQFHPEATPGPEDANYLFDEFLGVMRK